MAKTLYLIDGHYQIYRAFYGLSQPLSSPTGEPTAATHVFCAMLFALIRERRPDYLAMCMDVSDETVFRRDLDANYKAHRDAMPEGLIVQADRIVSIVEALGVPVIRSPGFEADDVMAGIAERLGHEEIDVYLVSRDKDLEQLISDRVRLYDPMKDIVIDAAGLVEAKGYRPEQAVEVQTLVGDSTDNIPGVVGVGLKTAAKLIAQFGTAAAVIENADQLTPKMRERVKEFAPSLERTRQLVTLRRDTPFEFDLAQCAVSKLRPAAVKPILKELGMTRLVENLDALRKLLGMETREENGGSAAVTTAARVPDGFAGAPPKPPPRATHQVSPAMNGVARAREARAASDDSGPARKSASPGRRRAKTRVPASGGELFPSDDTESPTVVGLGEGEAVEAVTTPETSVAGLAAQPAGPQAPPGEYTLVDTPESLDAFVSELVRQPRFAIDTETTRVRPVDARLVGVSFSWQAGRAYYIPVRAAVGRTLPVELAAAKLKPILENPKVGKIGHHLKYDLVVLRQIGIEVKGVEFDTLLASFVLDPARRSHGLDSLAKGLLGLDMIPITDLLGKGRDQVSMEEVDPAHVCEYSGCDADFTWRLREALEPKIAGGPLERLFRETEIPLIEVLADMENNGITVDTELLRRLGVTLSDRILELQREVQQAAGSNFNLDSPKQLATVLFDHLGFSVVRNTKTGRSTDADTLEALAAQTDHPVPKLILEYRELTKLKNTYVDTLPTMICKRTGRIHASFHQHGAVTGRLSSSDPNLQNIPIRTETGKQIREAFVAASPDHVLLAADYSQIELRVLAHFSEDPALLAAFESGQDIHRAVAAQVAGIPLETVSGAQRSAAKAVNFGIIYGQTPFGLSRTLGIPTGEARKFIEAYFQRYPGVRRFIDHCIAEARRKGFAETILGRRRPITELQSRNRGQMAFGERIAVNTVVQGSAADLIKRAMIDIHREIERSRRPSRMLLQVHDELVFQVPKAALDGECAMIRAKMENPIKLRVPLVADISWGRTWAEAK